MGNRRLVLIGSLGLALPLVGLTFLALMPRSPVNPGNCDLIQDVMSQAQVEAILGGPAHESEPIIRTDPDTGEVLPTGKVIRRWFGDGGSIVIVAHEDETVSGAVYYPSEGVWG